ncbi:MAG: MBL fold metallo-hydrolase [Pseudomonadota bacterium]
MPDEAQTQFAMRLLGTGNAAALALGNASAVLEVDSAPALLIDCGFDTLQRFASHYDGLPAAVYITHCHLDHIGGLEGLFFRVDPARPLKVYVPASIVPLLHQRMGGYPGALAEGGANFWDRFQLIPVGRQFWHIGLRFDSFAVRHHEPLSAFGLRLAGHFVWTGDTRPIPELMTRLAEADETVFHDCGLHGNPSHSGLADLQREYPRELLERFVVYHYDSETSAEAMRAAGLRVANPGERFAV